VVGRDCWIRRAFVVRLDYMLNDVCIMQKVPSKGTRLTTIAAVDRNGLCIAACTSHLCAAGREALFDEDLTESEVDEELAPLSVQLAYVLGRLGRAAEAGEVYDKLIRG
jgi:hypothetical protein